jgi:hypothetical protein
MPRAKTAKKTPVSKSDFIRSQPATLSVAEVLAKAKAASLKITPQLVYKVRGSAKGKGKAKKTAAAQMAPVSGTKTSASTEAPKSKAAFVRGLPASTPAKDIVQQAKAHGLSLSINYIYNIRGAAKMAAKKKRATAKGAAVSTTANGSGPRVAASTESLLKAIAAELGLGSAIGILQGERARIRAVISG